MASPFRKRFQYKLRTLLLALLVSGPVAYCARQLYDNRSSSESPAPSPYTTSYKSLEFILLTTEEVKSLIEDPDYGE